MELGDNTKAALLTRGIAEMARLGVALGGRAETFSGLSGVGDMIVTCMSGHSRNRHVGDELGKGKKLAEITQAIGDKNKANECGAYSPRIVLDATGRRSGNAAHVSGDPKEQFESLFKR